MALSAESMGNRLAKASVKSDGGDVEWPTSQDMGNAGVQAMAINEVLAAIVGEANVIHAQASGRSGIDGFHDAAAVLYTDRYIVRYEDGVATVRPWSSLSQVQVTSAEVVEGEWRDLSLVLDFSGDRVVFKIPDFASDSTHRTRHASELVTLLNFALDLLGSRLSRLEAGVRTL